MSIIHWLEDHFLSCPFKEDTGLDCPGCGMQRSIVALLKGDLAESFVLYPALLPLLAMLLLLVVHIKFKLANGASLLTGLFVVNVAIILVNYVYKMSFLTF